MERRVQKLSDPEETTTVYSLPLPIAPLSSTPTAVPTKRIGITTSGSGVNSTPAFSLTMPTTPNIPSLQTPTFNFSTSHMMTRQKPPIQPFTLIHQVIHNNTRKCQFKALKHNQSEPDHPDSQSVLCT